MQDIATRAIAILTRSIEVLAGVLFAWREMWRARSSLLVRRDNDSFIVHKASARRGSLLRTARHTDSKDAPGDPVLATIALGARASDEVLRAARSGLVLLELADEDVVMRRLSVPAQAREFLPGIVRNQVDRLSPWQADQAVYGFDAVANSDDAAALDVRVFICSRPAIDSARDALEGTGLSADRIVAQMSDGTSPVALWSRLADVPREAIERRRRQIGASIMVLVLASLGVSLWAAFSAASLRTESDELAGRSKNLQRQLQEARTPQALASARPEERAWILKEISSSAVVVLEALSRALPDDAYVTELRIDSMKLRVIGLAANAPALVAPIERSGHFADVRFAAPTTRGPDGALFRFHIEARVVPHLEITEN
jgi:general secretion pathway protein L